MHWQIGKGGGFHYAVAEARDEALPVTVFLGGPPALILAAIAPLPENVPELLLASLVAGQAAAGDRRPGRRTRSWPMPSSPSSARCRRGCAAPKGRSATTTATTRCATTTRSSRWSGSRTARRDLSGDGRRQAAAGGLLHRRPAAGAALAALPAGDAGGRALWSYGETGYHSLAAAVVKQRYAREAMARAFRILGEGQLSLTKFLLVHRPRRSTSRTSVQPSNTCSPEPSRDRPLRLLEPVDGHPRLHRPDGERGVEGGLARAGRPRARSATRVPPAGGAAAGRHESRVFSPGCLVMGGPRYADDPEAAARLAATRRSPAGRCSC